MLAPRRLGISLRLKCDFHRATTRKAARAAITSAPPTRNSARIRSMVRRTKLVPLAEARGQALRKALSQFAPQQARRESGGFLNAGGQFHELADVFFNVASGDGIQFGFFFEERGVVAEIDAEVALLLVGAFIEQRAEAGDAHQAGA